MMTVLNMSGFNSNWVNFEVKGNSVVFRITSPSISLSQVVRMLWTNCVTIMFANRVTFHGFDSSSQFQNNVERSNFNFNLKSFIYVSDVPCTKLPQFA